MAVVVIDTIKPKNQGTFPIVEAADVKVTNSKRLDAALNDKANQSDMTAVQTAVAGKASQSDLTALSNTVADKADKSALAETNAAVAGKQDALSTAQLTAVNSGITSELVTQISTNTTAISGKASAADLATTNAAVATKASQSDLTALSAEVDTKADESDLTTATANLQSQIDAIVTPATQDAEVQNARVDAEGVSHTTLKERIDSTETKLNTDIAKLRDDTYNSDNLLLNAIIVKNNYYSGGTEHSAQTLSYAKIPMLSSKTYVLSETRMIAYATGDPVASYTTDGYEFTPSSDTDVYITFYNDVSTHSEWKVYEKGKDGSRIGTYQNPALSKAILANELGDNSGIAISQKAVSDAIAAPITALKISGTTIEDGTDLSPLIVERGDNAYYASGAGGTITKYESASFNYFKLPINGAGTYYLDESARWWFTTNALGEVVDASSATVNTKITTTQGATLLWVSYNITGEYSPTRKIAKGTEDVEITPANTVYILPNTVKGNKENETEATLAKVDESRNATNIFEECEIVENQAYYNDQWYDYTSFSVFIFEAESGETYKFGCELRYLANESGNIQEYVAENGTYTPAADMKLYCTVRNSDAAKWKAVKLPDDIELVNAKGQFSFKPYLVAQDTGTSKTKVMSQYAVTRLIGMKDKLYGKGYAKDTGNLNDGDSLTVPSTNVMKNNVYSFMCYVTTLGSVLIGHGYNAYSGSWVEITPTKVIMHRYTDVDNTTEYEHGLTISDYLYVQIEVTDSYKAKIIVFGGGSQYVIPEVTWTGNGTGNTFATSDGSTLTDCVLTWSSEDFRKSIWMFGDSYFGMTNATRWVKYLIDSGYADNVLLNSYAGEDSTYAVPSLQNMIQYYGKPNMIVWCMGMNDGGDSNNATPATAWANGISTLLSICDTYDITPILATIPTVPNINHEAKNAYVRSSGKRYIDFAEAVGADGTGAWFTGMLSSDNVHPDTAGAIALYHRALTDCPEITFSNP